MFRQRALAQDVAAFHIVSCSEGFGIAEAGCACLVLWQTPVTDELFQQQRQALDEVVARYPGTAGFVCVIAATIPPPEERLRRASAAMIEGHGDRLRWTACVIEGDGFQAAVVRSVLAGMALLLPGRRPDTKFAATLGAATPWIASRSGVQSAYELIKAHDALRLRLSGPLGREGP